jgi:mono/diheme cytochrome c family protein
MKNVMGMLLAGGFLLAAVVASGQQTTETYAAGPAGEEVYKTYCATCHGKTAKGDGPLAAHLRFAPPDLTLLAKRNEGKFDTVAVHRMIDGRQPLKGHGGPDMPVWGDAFRKSGEGYSEKAVKERIDSLVTHLKKLQQEEKLQDKQ